MADRPPKKQRAAPVPAPHAVRLTLTGIMAVPDDFGRIRILLMDQTRDGRPDKTWAVLRDSISRPYAAYRTPYKLHPVDTEGVRGEFWVSVPARHQKHWLGIAKETRGREVWAEVTVRPFSHVDATKPASVSGAALDLALLEEVRAPK